MGPGICAECGKPCESDTEQCEVCIEVEGPDNESDLNFEDKDCKYWENLE